MLAGRQSPVLIVMRAGFGVLLLWAAATIIYGVVFNNFDSIATPLIVVPALILALLGSLTAAYVAAVFFLLDILNTALGAPLDTGSILLHIGLLVVAVLSLLAARKTRQAGTTTSVDSGLQPAASVAGDLAGQELPAAAGRGAIWRRINTGVVVTGSLIAFLSVAIMIYFVGSNGSIPIALVSLSLVASGLIYTVAAVLVARLGPKHVILIWLAPILVCVLGAAALVLACPLCTWASR